MAGLTSYETLRRSILEQIGTEDIDATDRVAVLDVINRAVVSYQQDAARGAHPPMKDPGDVVERLRRSLLEAGPLTQFFNNPDLASEIGVKDDTITATTVDGRQRIVGDTTTRDEMLAVIARLMADAGVAVDAEHPVAVSQIWDNQVRASVSIPPVSDDLDATFRIYRAQNISIDDLVEWGLVVTPSGGTPQGVPAAPLRRPTDLGATRCGQDHHRGGEPALRSRNHQHPNYPRSPRARSAPSSRRPMVARWRRP